MRIRWRKPSVAGAIAVVATILLAVGVVAVVSDSGGNADGCGGTFPGGDPDEMAELTGDELVQVVARAYALRLDRGEHGAAYELLSTGTRASLDRDGFDRAIEDLAGRPGAAVDVTAPPVVDEVPGGLGGSDRAWVVTFTGWVDDGQDLVMGGFPVVVVPDERSTCGGLAVELTAPAEQVAEQALAAVFEEQAADPERAEAVAPPTVQAALLEQPRQGASYVTGYRVTDTSDSKAGYYLIAALFDGEVACVVADRGEQTFDGPCIGPDDPQLAFWTLPNGSRRLVVRVSPNAARAEAVGRQSSGALYVSGGEVAGDGPLAIFDSQVPEGVAFHVVRVFDGEGHELVRYDIDGEPTRGS